MNEGMCNWKQHTKKQQGKLWKIKIKQMGIINREIILDFAPRCII